MRSLLHGDVSMIVRNNTSWKTDVNISIIDILIQPNVCRWCYWHNICTNNLNYWKKIKRKVQEEPQSESGANPRHQRKKKMTQINLCIANKQMHDKLKDQLPLPQARWSNAKRSEKQIDKEQDKTKHEAPRSVNYRATQNKNNIGTIALTPSGRGLGWPFSVQTSSLVPIWFLIQKIHKKFGSRNGFLAQSMHLSENTKSNRSLWRNKERVLLANPPLQARVKGNH